MLSFEFLTFRRRFRHRRAVPEARINLLFFSSHKSFIRLILILRLENTTFRGQKACFSGPSLPPKFTFLPRNVRIWEECVVFATFGIQFGSLFQSGSHLGVNGLGNSLCVLCVLKLAHLPPPSPPPTPGDTTIDATGR